VQVRLSSDRGGYKLSDVTLYFSIVRLPNFNRMSLLRQVYTRS